MNVTAEVITNEGELLNLWKHECTRVIADRFVNQQDTDWFLKASKLVIEEDISLEAAEQMNEEPYFVDFMRDMPELTGKPDISWIHVLRLYLLFQSFPLSIFILMIIIA